MESGSIAGADALVSGAGKLAPGAHGFVPAAEDPGLVTADGISPEEEPTDRFLRMQGNGDLCEVSA